MARAFVAFVPPRDVLDAIGKVSWRASHRPSELALPRLLGPRWTTRGQWHLTLQFLGNGVDLDAAATALTTVRASPARVRLGGLGGFPSERNANVLWVGVTEGAREMTAIARAVNEAMLSVVAAEEREYHPHLTLARLARAADLRTAVVASRGRIGPQFVVDRVTLFESVFSSTGARYRAHGVQMLD